MGYRPKFCRGSSTCARNPAFMRPLEEVLSDKSQHSGNPRLLVRQQEARTRSVHLALRAHLVRQSRKRLRSAQPQPLARLLHLELQRRNQDSNQVVHLERPVPSGHRQAEHPVAAQLTLRTLSDLNHPQMSLQLLAPLPPASNRRRHLGPKRNSHKQVLSAKQEPPARPRVPYRPPSPFA